MLLLFKLFNGLIQRTQAFFATLQAPFRNGLLSPIYPQKYSWYVRDLLSWGGGKVKAGGEGDDRGWEGWMASPAQWTWVWVNSRSWWWTGRPGLLQLMGSQNVRQDWVTELTDWTNWTNWLTNCSLRKAFLSFLVILWNSAFRWVYLSFSPLFFTSLLFTAIWKASSDGHFAFLHSFYCGWFLSPVQCQEPPSIVHQALCLSDLVP